VRRANALRGPLRDALDRRDALAVLYRVAAAPPKRRRRAEAAFGPKQLRRCTACTGSE